MTTAGRLSSQICISQSDPSLVFNSSCVRFLFAMDGIPLEILFVEGNERDARLFGEIFASRLPAAQIRWVRALRPAMGVLARQSVDLVILNPELPDVSGLHALTQLCQRASNVPIVVLAPNGSKLQGLQAIQLGAQDYLGKASVSEESLIRSLEYAIERKRLVNSIRQRDAELAHLSPFIAIDEIVSSLAHELRQPLTAINNYAEASIHRLVANSEDARQRVMENLAAVSRQASHGREILRSMKKSAARHYADPQPVHLSEVICDSLSLLDPEVRRTEADIVLQLDARLPPVCADKTQLVQVVLNLVRNALEAILASGSLRREICLWTTKAGCSNVSLSVSDWGSGFVRGVEGRLFEPFFTTKKDGLGLGLAICRSIVEAHEGRIEARRNRHGGATFTVIMPASHHPSASGPEEGLAPLVNQLPISDYRHAACEVG